MSRSMKVDVTDKVWSRLNRNTHNLTPEVYAALLLAAAAPDDDEDFPDPPRPGESDEDYYARGGL